MGEIFAVAVEIGKLQLPGSFYKVSLHTDLI